MFRALNLLPNIVIAYGAQEDAVLGGSRGGRAEEQHLFALPEDVRCVSRLGLCTLLFVRPNLDCELNSACCSSK